MTYRIALFRCLSCGRKTPEGLLCKAHAADESKHFHTLRRDNGSMTEQPELQAVLAAMKAANG